MCTSRKSPWILFSLPFLLPPHLLNDRRIQKEFSICSLHNLLFHCSLRDKSEDADLGGTDDGEERERDVAMSETRYKGKQILGGRTGGREGGRGGADL